jgi:hypothetical protein
MQSLEIPQFGVFHSSTFFVTEGTFTCHVNPPAGGGSVRMSQMDDASVDVLTIQFSEKILLNVLDGPMTLPREWTPRISPHIDGTFTLTELLTTVMYALIALSL